MFKPTLTKFTDAGGLTGNSPAEVSKGEKSRMFNVERNSFSPLWRHKITSTINIYSDKLGKVVLLKEDKENKNDHILFC